MCADPLDRFGKVLRTRHAKEEIGKVFRINFRLSQCLTRVKNSKLLCGAVIGDLWTIRQPFIVSWVL
jgi:hypothetical protein